MPTLIDDRYLSRRLQGLAPDLEGPVFTTGLWYVRLCQAALGPHRTVGQLSGPIAALPPTQRDAALRALLELPADIDLVSLRELAPTIAQLRHHHQLNLLSIEALATAKTLNAGVILTAPSPKLEAALEAEGLAWERRHP